MDSLIGNSSSGISITDPQMRMVYRQSLSYILGQSLCRHQSVGHCVVRQWMIMECQGQADADLEPDKSILSSGSIIKWSSGH